VFGLAHQSGVVPALRALPELTSGASAAALSNDSRKSGTKYEEGDDARDASNKKTVLFWRTYPPPLALLANFAKKPEPRERVGFEPKTTGYSKPRRRLDVSSVLDLQGASVQALLETVSKSDTARGTFLVAPVTAAAEFSTFVSARRGAGADGNGDGVVTLRLIWKRGGHFSGEELGGLRDAFGKKGENGEAFFSSFPNVVCVSLGLAPLAAWPTPCRYPLCRVPKSGSKPGARFETTCRL
jgi:hypothetical protein